MQGAKLRFKNNNNKYRGVVNLQMTKCRLCHLSQSLDFCGSGACTEKAFLPQELLCFLALCSKVKSCKLLHKSFSLRWWEVSVSVGGKTERKK